MGSMEYVDKQIIYSSRTWAQLIAHVVNTNVKDNIFSSFNCSMIGDSFYPFVHVNVEMVVCACMMRRQHITLT